MTTFAAVDLGASSGRVITGTLSGGRLELREAARFPNGPVEVPTPKGQRRHWDVLRLWQSVSEGLRTASHDVGPLEAVGIDTWAVDYGLLDADGELLGNPASYRCDRTVGAPEAFFAELPADELYALNGLQVQPFNTVFQLVAEAPERLARAAGLLLVPDLLGYWLTGRRVTEVTNASTTGMLDPRTRRWRPEVLETLAQRFGRDVSPLLAELVEPGHVVGPVNTEGLGLTTAVGAPTPLVAVGTHDTASAVVAIPAERPDFAYISCGTWSLVGLELPEPVLGEDARAANLTNELGVDGTVRFLKNVMGLWVFNESVRTWRERRMDVDVPELVSRAAAVPGLRTVVDVDDAAFFPPGDMPSRIAEAARRTGQPQPETPAEFARCIFDSLAIAYARAIRRAADISGREVGVVHIVGGGVRNQLLCQLTADATGLPVVAGPDEGTALGNLVVQARAVGLLAGGLPELRAVVRASSEPRTYLPSGDAAQWERAAGRIG
ncbi:rhamnulokinase [Tessaracoccus rhinocerotis]|uniref:Rhamnulokinase n=1 Tax=Tessaracoccus rhinocerotis TaxID=1689449 RepID=A0A553K4L6_9ACTN|nr:rhamnulokinase family protein [Tessaracoccus rhinocerotis]TRY19650.1 rhamnulokinase [Tessaracoccus rhinocerotis]